jgi:hypothetical protein
MDGLHDFEARIFEKPSKGLYRKLEQVMRRLRMKLQFGHRGKVI